MKKSAIVAAIVVLCTGLAVAQEPPGWVPLGNLPYATEVRSVIEVPDTSILVACGSSSSTVWPKVWRSTDAGASWTGVLTDMVYPYGIFNQLARDSASGRIWVIESGSSGSSTLYYSNNNGLNWTGVAGPSPDPAIGANCIEVKGDYVYFGGTIVSPHNISLYRLHQTNLTWDAVVVYPECDAITQLKWQGERLFVFCRDMDEAKVRVFTYTP